ncbi:uncharacterized protein EAE98_009935 [Botrytis deweyae]|uniref:Uncharacterized protein n=1 Tax=Botrytis deweyae TaxID=2478750 RepID=A0ABQ7IAA1_9HELO|nr:uncharacterized protein EAE98_009935 [Botrytis deweyae]KAF7917907.1 hypothetical protein EAE98_009935 [Botrytis deweyae]
MSDDEFEQAPDELSVDVVTAHDTMVRLETSAKKSINKSQDERRQNFSVLLVDLFNYSVKRTILMILIGVLGYFLASRGVVAIDYYFDQREMVSGLEAPKEFRIPHHTCKDYVTPQTSAPR